MLTKWFLKKLINFFPSNISCSEIDRIKNELAKVEDMSNFTENCRSSDFGLSFLHVAAMHDLTDIMNELVQFGADVDSEDNAGQSPIVYGILFSKYKNGKMEIGSKMKIFGLIEWDA